jgi:hypothetical protein
MRRLCLLALAALAGCGGGVCDPTGDLHREAGRCTPLPAVSPNGQTISQVTRDNHRCVEDLTAEQRKGLGL